MKSLCLALFGAALLTQVQATMVTKGSRCVGIS